MSLNSLFLQLLFFFFKQKTAYEMRISDWSSDVCSSDLGLAAAAQGLMAAQGLTCACCSRGTPQPVAPAGAAPQGAQGFGEKSEERRVGKKSVSTYISRWSP